MSFHLFNANTCQKSKSVKIRGLGLSWKFDFIQSSVQKGTLSKVAFSSKNNFN